MLTISVGSGYNISLDQQWGLVLTILKGNPAHLKFVSDSLREKFAKDQLHILVVKRNAGSFTYDGIELGGERVTREIEETLEELAANGHEIKKISVIGYSLGGLIARYAIGLLYHKGVFKRLEPVVSTASQCGI